MISPCWRRSSPASFVAAPGCRAREGRALAAVLADLDEVLLPAMTHWQSPRFFAYFANTGSEPGVLAELLAAGLNQVGILWRTSPALQELEEVTLDWLAQLLALPSGSTATSRTPPRPGRWRRSRPPAARRPDARRRLLRARALVGREGVPILGLEARATPVDEDFRLRPEALDLSGACAVVATIGTTSTSSIDPVAAIADACQRDGAWLHVDAAYAGSAAVCPELRDAFAGWERGRLVVVNPHKWLLTPMGCSALWTRRPDDLRAAFSLVPEYLRVSEEVASLSEYSPAPRPSVPRPQALGRAPLLRAREGLQERIREAIALAALVEGWVRTSRAGS